MIGHPFHHGEQSEPGPLEVWFGGASARRPAGRRREPAVGVTRHRSGPACVSSAILFLPGREGGGRTAYGRGWLIAEIKAGRLVRGASKRSLSLCHQAQGL